MSPQIAKETMTATSDLHDTREALSKLISKPKCTDKLLARPPFRFLFDVILAIDAASDLGLDRVLTTDEFDSSNVKDKASKLAFLEKVVKHTEARLNTTIDINVKEVVAGLDTAKTRAFLRLLALTANTGSNSEDATDSILTGDDNPVAAYTSSADIKALQKPSSLEDTIIETRASISAIIDKPKCTDKLLARPPFRFLFDVIIAVDAASDLGLDRVLTTDEFDSSNVKDKPSKLAFLDKVVKHTEARLDTTTIDINVKKIVAGLEPEKTCAFLRLLALAATSSMTTPDRNATDDDGGSPTGTEDEALFAETVDAGLVKVEVVSDALDLTAESQFLSIAKEENEPDDNANLSVDTIEVNVVGDLEIVDGGGETPKDADTVNTGEDDPAADVSVTGENSETKSDATSASISQVANNDTIWPQTSKLCSPVDDAVEVPCAEMMIVESDCGDGASDDMIDAGAAPINLRETIEAILGMTTPLGQCLGDIDVGALNQERAYRSNEVAVERRQFDEHHRLQNATVAPLIKRSEDLDADIALKEEEIEAVLGRIGGEVGKN